MQLSEPDVQQIVHALARISQPPLNREVMTSPHGLSNTSKTYAAVTYAHINNQLCLGYESQRLRQKVEEARQNVAKV